MLPVQNDLFSGMYIFKMESKIIIEMFSAVNTLRGNIAAQLRKLVHCYCSNAVLMCDPTVWCSPVCYFLEITVFQSNY